MRNSTSKLACAAREALDDRTRWDDAVHTALAIVVPIVAAIWFFAGR